MLEARSLQFAYPGQKSISFPDLTLQTEEQGILLGQSGKGKTTFLHMVSGLLKPSQGQVFVNGIELSQLSARELDRFRGEQIGLMFQKPVFAPALSVWENLLLACSFSSKSPDQVYMKDLLSLLNLSGKERRKPQQLSSGEQQRLSLARALAHKPSLILADEPTSALDDENCEKVIHLLKKSCAEASATLLVVTHDQRVKQSFQRSFTL
jgi:putative ABC transport system ATP-binding protein